MDLSWASYKRVRVLRTPQRHWCDSRTAAARPKFSSRRTEVMNGTECVKTCEEAGQAPPARDWVRRSILTRGQHMATRATFSTKRAASSSRTHGWKVGSAVNAAVAPAPEGGGGSRFPAPRLFAAVKRQGNMHLHHRLDCAIGSARRKARHRHCWGL